MALGDNKAFFNETTFLLGDQQSGTTAISGLDITAIGGGAIDSPVAKVLFTEKAAILGETFHLGKILDTSKNLQFEIKFGSRYFNEEIAIITAEREAIQVTLHVGLSAASVSTSQAFQLSAKGFNSVGPTLRRLHHLGYV